MAGSSEPAFYLGAKKGAIAQSPIYFLVILRQPLFVGKACFFVACIFRRTLRKKIFDIVILF